MPFAPWVADFGLAPLCRSPLATSTGGPCGAWDAPTARALAHPYFQPFTWPLMRDTSASHVDVKFYNGNELLGHWIFRGYRSDTDLTVQQAMVDEVLIRAAHQGRFRPSVVISVFIGWRVSVLSFEVGGRSYSVGPNGAVFAGDHGRAKFELRVTARSSGEAFGNDADRVDFRYRDANNRIDLKCGRASVPQTWLTISHISGPSLIRMINDGRAQGARIEGPQHIEQFAQLAAIHHRIGGAAQNVLMIVRQGRSRSTAPWKMATSTLWFVAAFWSCRWRLCRGRRSPG